LHHYLYAKMLIISWKRSNKQPINDVFAFDVVLIEQFENMEGILAH